MYGHPHYRSRWQHWLRWSYRMDLISAVSLFIGATCFWIAAAIGLWKAW